ncbi:MAG: hypothetical protein ABIH72_04380 [archaeon]
MTLLSRVEGNLSSSPDIVLGRKTQWSLVRNNWLHQIVHFTVAPEEAIQDIEKLNRLLEQVKYPGAYEIEEFEKAGDRLRLGRIKYYSKPKIASDPEAIAILELAENHNGKAYEFGKADDNNPKVIRVKGCERDIYVNIYPSLEFIGENSHQIPPGRYISYEKFKKNQSAK